jgi:hypothetical protein
MASTEGEGKGKYELVDRYIEMTNPRHILESQNALQQEQISTPGILSLSKSWYNARLARRIGETSLNKVVAENTANLGGNNGPLTEFLTDFITPEALELGQAIYLYREAEAFPNVKEVLLRDIIEQVFIAKGPEILTNELISLEANGILSMEEVQNLISGSIEYLGLDQRGRPMHKYSLPMVLPIDSQLFRGNEILTTMVDYSRLQDEPGQRETTEYERIKTETREDLARFLAFLPDTEIRKGTSEIESAELIRIAVEQMCLAVFQNTVSRANHGVLYTDSYRNKLQLASLVADIAGASTLMTSRRKVVIVYEQLSASIGRYPLAWNDLKTQIEKLEKKSNQEVSEMASYARSQNYQLTGALKERVQRNLDMWGDHFGPSTSDYYLLKVLLEEGFMGNEAWNQNITMKLSQQCKAPVDSYIASRKNRQNEDEVNRILKKVIREDSDFLSLDYRNSFYQRLFLRAHQPVSQKYRERIQEELQQPTPSENPLDRTLLGVWRVVSNNEQVTDWTDHEIENELFRQELLTRTRRLFSAKGDIFTAEMNPMLYQYGIKKVRIERPNVRATDLTITIEAEWNKKLDFEFDVRTVGQDITFNSSAFADLSTTAKFENLILRIIHGYMTDGPDLSDLEENELPKKRKVTANGDPLHIVRQSSRSVSTARRKEMEEIFGLPYEQILSKLRESGRLAPLNYREILQSKTRSGLEWMSERTQLPFTLVTYSKETRTKALEHTLDCLQG